MEYGFSVIVGYLIGSIPIAFLIMKKARGLDITNAGTGNVGAMNAYEVSDSKMLGIVVLILDVMKGVLSVYLPQFFFSPDFTISGLSLLAAVFSHCFNPWLGFKGGRGLATAAGGVVILFPIVLLIWLILWAIIFFIKKDIHLANILSTLLSLFTVFNIVSIAYKYTYPRTQSISELVMFFTGLFLLILIKHIEPLKDLLKDTKIFYRKR